jgi:hypothetical protein
VQGHNKLAVVLTDLIGVYDATEPTQDSTADAQMIRGHAAVRNVRIAFTVAVGQFDALERAGMFTARRLLHARPWQEEREVLADLADRETDRLARLGVCATSSAKSVTMTKRVLNRTTSGEVFSPSRTTRGHPSSP